MYYLVILDIIFADFLGQDILEWQYVGTFPWPSYDFLGIQTLDWYPNPCHVWKKLFLKLGILSDNYRSFFYTKGFFFLLQIQAFKDIWSTLNSKQPFL